MQLKRIILLAFASFIIFSSCSKEKNKPAEVSIEGKWTGKFSVLSEPYNSFYGFNIKPNGIIELVDSVANKTGEGSWELEDGVLSATYSFLPPASGTRSVIANFNKTTGELDGTWGTGTQIYGGGYWYMIKAQ
jgi:hypothetical protein